MDITPTFVYLITRLNALKVTGALMFGVGFMTSLALVLPICSDDFCEEALSKMKRAMKWFLAIGIVGLLICVFVPTKKEAAAILVIPHIANSETIDQINSGVKTLAIEWLEELRPATKKGENK